MTSHTATKGHNKQLETGAPGKITLSSPVCRAESTGQTIGNMLAPKYYIFPINNLPHRTPLIFLFFFNPEKNPRKGHLRAGTLAEFKEKCLDNIFTICRYTSEPLNSDLCTRLKTQIPVHSNSWGCPKIVRHSDPISLLISTFGIYLEPGCKTWSNHSFLNC